MARASAARAGPLLPWVRLPPILVYALQLLSCVCSCGTRCIRGSQTARSSYTACLGGLPLASPAVRAHTVFPCGETSHHQRTGHAGALESLARIDRTDRGPNYSEQQMIDCVTEAAGYSSNGCDGGTAGETIVDRACGRECEDEEILARLVGFVCANCGGLHCSGIMPGLCIPPALINAVEVLPYFHPLPAEDVFTFISASFVAQESGYPPYIARQGGRCRAASTVGAATVKRRPGYDVVPGNPGKSCLNRSAWAAAVPSTAGQPTLVPTGNWPAAAARPPRAEAIMRSIVQTGPVLPVCLAAQQCSEPVLS